MTAKHEHVERETVHEPFSSERSKDPFRLAIVGFGSIEQALNGALADAIGGQLPDALRRTHFNVRVSLAVALGLMPPEVRGPLGTLKQFRDEFAHAKREDLAPGDGRVLLAAMRELAPDVDKGFTDESPSVVLASFLVVLRGALNASFEKAAERRRHQDEAVRSWWTSRTRRDPITALFGEDVDHDRVARLISALPPQERAIFTLRFYGSTTLEEIGRVFGMTRERVRQMEARSINSIRAALAEDQPTASQINENQRRST